MRRTATQAAVLLIYLLASLQFVRYYSKSTTFYLNMQRYLAGHERLPFQERILPALLLRPMFHLPLFVRHFHNNGAFTPELGPFYLLSFISLVIAGAYTQKLYEVFTQNGSLKLLVFPILLFAVIWTYCLHSEADYSYPYDFPSLAFFAAGLYYIARRKFAGLFFVILLGTFNRETTLFLAGIYILDNVFQANSSILSLQCRLRMVPWPRVILLCATWLIIKLFLVYRFHDNNSSEQFLRIHFNLDRLQIRLVPAMLNICGYTLPLVVLFRKLIMPIRFRNYLYILFPWVIVMFCSGVLLETRIYGELCPYCAVALVLIMERTTHAPMNISAQLSHTKELDEYA